VCVWDNANVVTVLLEEAEAEEGGGAGRMQNNTTRTPYNNVGNCGKCMPVLFTQDISKGILYRKREKARPRLRGL
jgi:hypothetical protein